MSQYYYLMAQLPALSYQSALPLSPQAFRELCRPLMSATDAGLLEFCRLDPPEQPTGSPLLDAWSAAERNLRIALARSRAQKLRREADLPAGLRSSPAPAIEALARAALATESPLEAEHLLNRGRWQVIEANRGLEQFSRESALAYLLELLILERRDRFQADAGAAAYQAAYRHILSESDQRSAGVSS